MSWIKFSKKKKKSIQLIDQSFLSLIKQSFNAYISSFRASVTNAHLFFIIYENIQSILWTFISFPVSSYISWNLNKYGFPLSRWTFVGKVMSLLFNMLYRLVITFLPRSKHLLIHGCCVWPLCITMLENLSQNSDPDQNILSSRHTQKNYSIQR